MMNGNNDDAIDITAEPHETTAMAQQPQHDLIVSRPPEVVLEEARRAAVALKQVLDSKPKKVEFGGKRYLEVDDWTLLGRFYGVAVKITETKPVEYNGVRGWEAFAEAVRITDGTVLSRVESMCLSDEANWRNKPQMQLRSMAQTRACSRAFATVLRWVPVLAGYAGTPAEEMDDLIRRQGSGQPVRGKTTASGRRNEMVKRIHDLEAQLGGERLELLALEHGIGAVDEATDAQLVEYGKALRAELAKAVA